jgi:8-oxo-dGTP pyrophosphatase MutT (NUDIX family)
MPCFAMLIASQGGWEDDESLELAAKRETVEEAGVRGKLEVRQLLGNCIRSLCDCS